MYESVIADYESKERRRRVQNVNKKATYFRKVDISVEKKDV